MKILILGCGWSGISVAYVLKRRHPSVDVVVAEPMLRVGGLLGSEIINGFTVDIGGSHVIFSKSREVLDEILSFLHNNYISHQRTSYVLLNKYMIPYPFENGLYVLPPELRAEALVSFVEAMISQGDSWSPRNFLEWIYGAFGKWIADTYLIPYNLKVWKRPLNEISCDWVHTPGRLPVPNWVDVLKSAAGVRTEGYLEQATFYYPLVGGIQALHNVLLNRCIALGVAVVTGFKLEHIRRVGSEFIVNNDLRFNLVVNTLPLPEVLKVLDPPTNVVNTANRLDYNSVVITAVALRKEAPPHHWVYVPTHETLFHRYAWISNYSPYNAPKGTSLLIAETTIAPGCPTNLEQISSKVIEDLIKLDVIKENEILFTKSWFHKYGYPVYRLDHNEVRDMVIDWLSDIGILTTGRWGRWHYWNIDRVYREAVHLVNSL